MPNEDIGDELARTEKKDALCAPNFWGDGYLRCGGNDCRNRIGTPTCFTCRATAQYGTRIADADTIKPKVVYKDLAYIRGLAQT
eukprot:2491857-Pyramimonas_sp.AAC.1